MDVGEGWAASYFHQRLETIRRGEMGTARKLFSDVLITMYDAAKGIEVDARTVVEGLKAFRDLRDLR